MITSRSLLKVEGMTCEGCAPSVRDGLKREPGVQDVEVSWEYGVAEVAYDPGLADEERILASRVFRRKYRAPAVPSTGCC